MIVTVWVLIGLGFIVHAWTVLKAGFQWTIHKDPKPGPSINKISVIIPVRNEQHQLPGLLADIANQDIDTQLVQWIFVDDHSEDTSLSQLKAFCQHRDNAIVVTNPNAGKKQAIAHGVELAEQDWIVTTDADVSLPDQWIKGWVKAIALDPDLLVGGVRMEGKWQVFALEYALATGLGLSAASQGKALNCSGANLGFKKAVYQALTDTAIRQDIPSGDDIFLMHAVAGKRGKISALSNPDTVVTSRVPDSLGAVIRQRLRWSGKISAYQHRQTWVLVLANVLFYGGLWVLLFSQPNLSTLWILCGALLLKALADLPLAIKSTSFLGQKHLLLILLPIEFMYLIYLPLMGLSSQIFKSTWKGRSAGS